MEILKEIFGQGRDLTVLQMGLRGVAVFAIAFILIRISGRRSFGMRTPFDNIIAVMLGAVLSRAVVGASAFAAVVFASFVIVAVHRACGWLISRYKNLEKFFEGEKILLFENGEFLKRNMQRAQVCEEDIMLGVRKSCLTEDLQLIDKVYMEKNGEVSATKKNK